VIGVFRCGVANQSWESLEGARFVKSARDIAWRDRFVVLSVELQFRLLHLNRPHSSKLWMAQTLTLDSERGGHPMTHKERSSERFHCGTPFTFMVGEQESYASVGVTNRPQRCAPRRAARKTQRNGDGAFFHWSSSQSQADRVSSPR
jgi:hypothetical protein